MPRYEVIAHRRVAVRKIVKAPNKFAARREAATNGKAWKRVPNQGELPVEIVYVEEPIPGVNE